MTPLARLAALLRRADLVAVRRAPARDLLAGAVAAVFGGSNLQVSGPTGAMTVVLVPVFHRF